MTDIEKKAFEAYPRLTGCDAITLSSQGERRMGYIKCANEYESLPKIHGWVARDKANDLYFFPHDCKPHRTDGIFCSEVSEDILHIDNSMFPEVNWQTEPIEVELLIRKV